jgi:Na+-driven multidrug efflux pump
VHLSLKMASTLILILGFIWLTSQDSLGKLIRGKNSISSISEIQKISIDLFPTDVAMNHIDVIISNQLVLSGDDVLASQMLKEHLNTFPNSISGLRSWAEMNNITINNIDECELLSEIKRKFMTNQ